MIVSRELGGLELFRLAEPRVTILMSVASPKCRPALNLAEDVKRKRYDTKMARSEAKRSLKHEAKLRVKISIYSIFDAKLCFALFGLSPQVLTSTGRVTNKLAI